MIWLTRSLLTAGLLVIVITGCGGGDSPLDPSNLSNQSARISSQCSRTSLWGYWDVHLDLDTNTATATLDRQAMFAANVVTFLNGNPANLSFLIHKTISAPDYVDVDIDVSLTHPFPGLTQYNGYDVRGVFLSDGFGMMDYNNMLGYPIMGTDQFMLDDPVDGDGGGPDGYTRWFNAVEFIHSGIFGYTPGNAASKGYFPTATLNAYKYFADGLGAKDDVFTWLAENPDTRGAFSAGSKNTRNYYLRFPTPSPGVKFEYAVIANWEDVDIHPSNAVEAVAAEVAITEDAYYIDDTDRGGNIILDVSLWDWDSAVSNGVMEDYSIIIESTALVSHHHFDNPVPIGGGENFSTFHIEIPTDNLQGIEGNEVWVIAECPDENYKNEFGISNGAGEDKLAAFFRYDLPVGDCPSVNIADLSGMAGKVGGVEQAKQGGNYQTVQIMGTGFWGSSAEVVLKNHDNPADEIVAGTVTVIGPDEVDCAIEIPQSQSLGLYDVYVTNGCDNPKTGHADGLVEVVPSAQIIPWDEGPNGEFSTVIEPTGGATTALDLGVRQDDGGFYAVWQTVDVHQARAHRYNPDFTPEGSEVSILQGPQGVYEFSMPDYSNTFIDVNASGTAPAVGIHVGPYYYYEFDQNLFMTGTFGTNPFPIIGWPGIPFGLAGLTNTYEAGGAVACYDHILIFGWSERYHWLARPGENNGFPNSEDYPYVSSNTDPNWDFDGWLDGKCVSVSVGKDQSAIWALYTEAPYARRHADLFMHGYVTTEPIDFGDDGTGDGQLTGPFDMTIRLSDNRIYVLDRPGDEMRIQAFSNTTGDFAGTSGVIDLPDGITAYHFDYNDFNDLIYVLLNNNEIRVYKDIA